MSDSRPPALTLPANPNLRHLRDQAKDLLGSGLRLRSHRRYFKRHACTAFRVGQS